MPSIIPYLGQAVANAGAGTLDAIGRVVPPQYRSGFQSIGNNFGEAGNALGIYNGVTSGQPLGYLNAGVNAAQLGARSGLLTPQNSAALNNATGDLGAAMGVYSGIQQGGFMGDTQAAVNAARLATQVGMLGGASGAVAGYLPYANLPLAAYQFATQDTQSGRTGSDAMGGAMTGAEAGAAFGPIGMGVGALVGGAAGAIASAFGPGAEDPENAQWNNYAAAYNQNPSIANYLTPQQAYQNLSGEMDARNNSPGHSQPIEQVFGRMGEQNLMDQLTSYLNQQYQAGVIKPGESISQQWGSVINPWLQSKGAGIANQNTVKGAPEAGALTSNLQSLAAMWENGQLTPTSQVGIDGQRINGLSIFKGPSPLRLAQDPLTETTITYSGGAPHTVSSAPVPQAAARGGSMRDTTYPTYRQVRDSVSRAYLKKFSGGGSSALLGGSTGTGDGSLSIPSGTLNFGGDTGSSAAFGGNSYNSDPLLSSNSGTLNFGGVPAYNAAAANPFAYSSSNPYASTGSSAPSSSGNTWKDVLSALTTGGSAVNKVLGALKGYAPLVPLISALTSGNQGAQAPTLPSQYTGTLYNMSTPSFLRTQNPAMQNMTLNDWLTYGQSPEQQFYLNNALPATQMSAPNYQAMQAAIGSRPMVGSYAANSGGNLPSYAAAPPASAPAMSRAAYMANPYAGFADGGSYGSLEHLAQGGSEEMPYLMPPTSEAYVRGPHHGPVRGPGDGTSDDINAKLSDGEYIMDAHTVSLLGNGSNEAGARRLDEFRQRVRKDAGKKFVKGKQPMHAKKPAAYAMGGV